GVKLVPLGSGPSAVFENETVFEPGKRHQVARLLKRRLCLAAEADDEVAADGYAGNSLPTARHHLPIVLDALEAFHPLPYGLAPRLGRHMQVGTDLGEFPDGVEQVIPHVAREVRDELDPLNSVGVVDAC